MKADYILVCSPMRTGSTFVYNFFRECTEGYMVKKYEMSPMDFKEDVDFAPILFRHPVAVISSFIDFLKMEYNVNIISYAFERTKQQFEWANNLLQEFPNCTARLNYEDFYNNVDYLVDWTKNNLGYVCDSNKVNLFKQNYSIEKVKDLIKNNTQPETNLFQSNHISELNGDNKKRIDKIKEIRYYVDELINFSKKFGYEYE